LGVPNWDSLQEFRHYLNIDQMKLLFLAVISIFCLTAFQTLAGTPLKSNVYYWEKPSVKKTKCGETRQFLTGSTNHLDYLDVFATTLNPGKSAAGKDIQSKYEKLIIVKDGEILQTLNGEKRLLKNGSVVLLLAGEKFEIVNPGTGPASYYMLQWENTNRKIQTNEAGKLKSEIRAWEDVPFTATEKGGSRKFFNRPTNYLFDFEMHVTTLLEGIKSHDPHTHPDDEIILIKSGTVEQLINGQPHQFGAGSFVLLNGNDPHGIRNFGSGTCEYFAFRFLKNDPAH